MIAIVFLLLSSLVNIVLGYVLYRYTKRLLQFDELFELIADEFDINIRYFDKLMQKPLFMNSPEVEEAHHNMNLMRLRLVEIVSQMSELSNKDLSKPRLPAKPAGNPPVVA